MAKPRGTQKVPPVFESGVLRVADPDKTPGSLALYTFSWNAEPAATTECEGELKFIAASDGPAGMCIDFADGVHEEILCFHRDRINLHFANLEYRMDPCGDFHSYRVRIAGEDVQVSVDGKLVIDGRGKYTQPSEGGRNEVQFGAGSSLDTGEALWRRFGFQMRPAKPQTITVPDIPGLSVQAGETVLISRDASYPVVFQSADGRISVGAGNYNPTAGRWSSDGGHTWTDGPAPPNNAAIEFGEGEVLSLGFATRKRPDGKYALDQRRSFDGWRTVAPETGIVDIPKSVPCGGDGGETNDGFLMDHAVIGLHNGDLMAGMYGNYDEDKTPADDFPASAHFRKYRTIVVFSSDKGRTWGNPVTVAREPKSGQEGFCEPCLRRAANGDILCVMRTGGSCGKFTPAYVSRSTDEGRSWSEPVAILDRGVWPNLCVMKSGVIVCATGRPGAWLVFSDDDGRTWKGAFCIHGGGTSSYNSVVEVAPDTILVIYDREDPDERGLLVRSIVGTYFTVKRTPR